MRHQRFRGRVRDRRRELPRNESGGALVEFTIAASIFLLLLFGIMDLGRAMWMFGTVAHVAKEGARYGIVQGSDVNSTLAATQSAVTTYVQNEATNYGIGTVTVSFPSVNGCNANNNPGSCIAVQVSCQFKPVLWILSTITLTSNSQMVISF